MFRFFLLLLIALTPAAQPQNPEPTPAPVHRPIIHWSRGIADGTAWQREATKYLGTEPVVLMCHGGIKDGRWYLFPDAPHPDMPVEGAAALLHDAFGDGVPIVLIVCNEGHFQCHVLGVWYARDKVWDRPVPQIPQNSANVGDFREFWCGHP